MQIFIGRCYFRSCPIESAKETRNYSQKQVSSLFYIYLCAHEAEYMDSTILAAAIPITRFQHAQCIKKLIELSICSSGRNVCHHVV